MLSARLGLCCTKHPGQKVEYFCCGELICVLCVTEHSSHDSFVNIDRKSRQIKDSISGQIEKLEHKRTEIERKVTKSESLLRKNANVMKKNRENIHKRIKEIINHLKEIEGQLKDDCTKRHEQVSEIVNQMIREYSTKINDLKEVQEKCEKVGFYESSSETVRAGIKITKRIEHLVSFISYQDPIIPEFIAPESLPCKNIIRKIIGTINDDLGMDSDWTTGETEKFKIDKKFKWKHNNIGIAPIGTESAWLYSIDKGNPIYLISQNGDTILTYPNEKNRKIEKIVSTKLNNAWVTDLERCSVKLLRENCDLEHRFHVSPFHPFGICPSRCGYYVWICLADKQSFVPELKGRTKVAKMTPHGEEICFIESQNKKDFFSFPYRCSVNINEDICVVDRITETSGQVYIFDKDCQPKCGYIGTVVDKEFDPRDICCNSKGHIIVSDYSNIAIHILTSDGTPQRLLDMKTQDLQRPVTIATDKDDRIWITLYDGTVVIAKPL